MTQASPDQLYQTGQTHLLQNNPSAAVTALQSALQGGLSGHKVCEAHLLLGAAYVRLSNKDKALAELREAEAINDERTGSLRKLLKSKGWL